MKKIFSGIYFLLLPVSVFGGDFMPIAGIYYDNVLEGSGEVGVLYSYERVERDFEMPDGSKDRIIDHLKFIYIEGESNNEDANITLGLGQHFVEGSIRVRVSMIDKDNESLVGLEGVFTAFFFSFKAGLYKNCDSQSVEGMLGIGLSVTGRF